MPRKGQHHLSGKLLESLADQINPICALSHVSPAFSPMMACNANKPDVSRENDHLPYPSRVYPVDRKQYYIVRSWILVFSRVEGLKSHLY